MLHNLTEGFILVTIILMLFLGNVRAALIVAITIPFALLFASICLQLKEVPANLLSLGALDFGMVVDGAIVMVENIVRHLGHQERVTKSVRDRIRDAAHEVQRPVFYAITIIITAYLPIFTLQRVEGRLFRPMAWTVAFALLGAVIFSMTIAPVLASFAFRKETREWENPVLVWITRDIPARRYLDRTSPLGDGWRCRWPRFAAASGCCRAKGLDRSFCRTWMKARCGCAARWLPAPDPPKASGYRIRLESSCVRFPK